jgi:hypothetical protein
MVSKDGFLPSTTVLEIDEAREWVVRIELRPAETVKEEITVHRYPERCTHSGFTHPRRSSGTRRNRREDADHTR